MEMFNTKTGNREQLDSITDDRWMEFIPQDESCQGLYQLLVDHKEMDPKEAAITVLELVTKKD